MDNFKKLIREADSSLGNNGVANVVTLGADELGLTRSGVAAEASRDLYLSSNDHKSPSWNFFF